MTQGEVAIRINYDDTPVDNIAKTKHAFAKLIDGVVENQQDSVAAKHAIQKIEEASMWTTKALTSFE